MEIKPGMASNGSTSVSWIFTKVPDLSVLVMLGLDSGKEQEEKLHDGSVEDKDLVGLS
jgi:hypothetical protein